MTLFILWFLAAYVLGSVSFPVLLFKVLGKDDPRNRFSGNAGATNVYRQAGFGAAGLVLLLDLARAMTVAYVSVRFLPPGLVPWVCFGLILGNRFPCFHRFRGGKGVANYLGFTLVIAPVAALISMPVWLMVFRLCKHPFMASLVMVAVLSFGIASYYDYDPISSMGVLWTMILIVYNHKSNIREYFGKKKGE